MRIGIVGLGYVGLTLGIAAADNGIEVYGVETNQLIKDSLKNNKAHFYEPGLDALIKRHNGKEFFCVEEFPHDKAFDAFVITVGTPLKTGEKEPNFDYIKQALSTTIKKIYDGSQLVVLRSTVSVGTTRNVVLPYLAEISGKKEDEILVAMCPERTIEGKAVEELTTLPQIVSGNNEKAVKIAIDLFRHMTDYVIDVASLEEAELVKLYCNTYRDMTFALGNAFCMAAQTFGVDGINAIKHANQGYGRSNIAMPGFVAGPCLEKDAYILINNMIDCDSKDFIMQGRRFNESLVDIVIDWVNTIIGEPSAEKRITLSGMAFKGQPETSDLRGSSSVYIAEKLHSKGYKLNLHDFVAKKNEMEALQLGTVYDNIYDACKDSNLLLVLNNHKKYFDLQEHISIMKNKSGGFTVLDSWGVCKNLQYNENVDVRTLGNMLVNCSQNA